MENVTTAIPHVKEFCTCMQLPEMFGSAEEFDSWFGNKLARSGVAADDSAPAASEVLHAEQVLVITNRLHQVLRPFLLRRTKDVLQAELPSKTEHSIACAMSPYQEAMLQLLKDKGKEAQQGSVQGINNVVMEMRKVCCSAAQPLCQC
jgi:helicase SWR1